jgi:hypothetical protein
MCALIPSHRQNLPVWLRAVVWLALLLSPTGYCLLLMITYRMQGPALPQSFVVLLQSCVVLLFCLIPVVALLVCGTVVWRSKLRVGWRVGGLVLTVLAMLFQVGALVVIIVSAITVAISPAQ